MADGGFRITVKVQENSGRDARGRFAKGASNEMRLQLKNANMRLARAQQAAVVEHMEGSIIRRNVSSGRLLAVTGDPKNVRSTDSGWGVGDEEYLDHSMAKYWRQIEEGYSGHVGREITGMWGASITRIDGERVYGGPRYSRHNREMGKNPATAGMFIPKGNRGFRQQGRFAKYDGKGGKNGAPNFMKTTTIKNPITAHLDYEKAFRSFDPGRRSLEEVRRVLLENSVGAWMARAERAGRFH